MLKLLLEKIIVKINDVYGVKLHILRKKFSYQIGRLLKLGMFADEIDSELYYAICVCTQYHDSQKGEFFRYLYKTISKNLSSKIYELSSIKESEMPVYFDISYEEDSELIANFKKLDGPNKEALTDYCKGSISQTDFIEKFKAASLDYSMFIELVHHIDDE